MRDKQTPKRHRSSIDRTSLSTEDQLAFARVASLLQKPVSELYDGGSQSTSGNALSDLYVSKHSSQDWSEANWWNTDSQTKNDAFNINPQWTPVMASTNIESTPEVDFSQWTFNGCQTSEQDDLGHDPHENTQARPRRSSSWSHEPTTAEPWISLPTKFLDEASFPEVTAKISEDAHIATNSGTYDELTSSMIPGATLQLFRQDQELFDTTHGRFTGPRTPAPTCIPAPLDGFTSHDGELVTESDWERIEKPQISYTQSSPPVTEPGWSLVAPSKAHQNSQRDPSNFMERKSVQWISLTSKEERSLQKAVRRGPFQNEQLREETSNTRKLKACVRCRMQKVRCQIDPNNPSGICQTCQDVSKQRVHTLPCVRHKLTDCVLYRIGKAKGLEFTFRWPEMKLRDITEWASNQERTIKVRSDLCDAPLQLTVRKFVPIPQDTLMKSWMDGKKKKFKETTPYAIVNMTETVKVMGDYINKNIFECVAYWLKDKDEWVQETYKFAARYMVNAPPDEQTLLGDAFRLWFAIRRTATTEFIVGNDTLDMQPENKDRSYPLFGKVPLPPVMIQQLDMILTLGFLKPLRKKFLEHFQRLTMSNNPKSWMAIYLTTFIACHSCAAVTAEHYRNARKHGLKRKYAMPGFLAERHHSANVYLSHYHYCTNAHDPFTVISSWDKRETTQFADMSPSEFHFLRKSAKMLKEREEQIRDINEFDYYEDDLYFVTQMHEKNWSPRDTKLDYTEGTIGDVPLKH